MVWQAYRRVASKGACSFCLMLASRGAVYSSAENAVAGHKVDVSGHDHCHCSAELETDPANKDAIRIDPSDANKIIKAWIKQGKTATYDLAKFEKLGVPDVPKPKVPKAVVPKPRPKPTATQKFEALDSDETGNYFVTINGEEVWVVRELDEFGQRRGRWIYGGPVGPGITNKAVPKDLADWLDDRAPVVKSPDELKFEGLPRDPAMDPDEALRGTNPQYFSEKDEYSNNCTRCVVAYEMRRRGFVVEAAPRPYGDMVTRVVSDSFQTPMGGVIYRDRWVRHGSVYDVGEGMEDGARLIVRATWKSRSGGRVGHVFSAERRGGKTVFIEPQNGQTYTRAELKTYAEVEAVRVDEFVLRPGAVRYVTTPTEGRHASKLRPGQLAAESYRQGEDRFKAAQKLKSVKGQTRALKDALSNLQDAEKLYRREGDPPQRVLDMIADIKFRLASMP